MINVTRTFIPPIDEYTAILKRAWNNGWITNNGELLQELEKQLKVYLQVPDVLVCSNGTVVLQMALKALGITKEVITTPFSYVATANAIAWEGCKPVFVDIDPVTYCINPTLIEAAITEHTQAILATHVYGFACDVEAIDAIARKHGLKVIYDGAHAFGVQYNGNSLLAYGDISTCSFHATKVFHMGEGGGLFCNQPTLIKKLQLYRQFGHEYDDYQTVGINAKNSELHAAMGLAVLPYFEANIAARLAAVQQYIEKLPRKIVPEILLEVAATSHWNAGYMPIFLATEIQREKVITALTAAGIVPRKYFWPALNTLPFWDSATVCPVAEIAANCVLCLPLFTGIKPEEITQICGIVCQTTCS